MKPPARIAVFRALQLGDMLCAVPALNALRAACPEAHITLIGLPWATIFVERYPMLIDDLMIFPGAIGFPEQPETDAGLPQFYAEASARRFDLAIQLHGSGGVANDILFNLGAREHAGFVQPDEMRRGAFIPWPDHLPEVDRYLKLMQAIGVGAASAELYLPLHAADRTEAAGILDECGASDTGFVLIHPGAQLPSRRWPPERFAAVADALAASGMTVLVTGTATEKPLVQAVLDAMSRRAYPLAGRTTLGGMAALVARARLVVCNDTSVSHIAAALRTRSVVIASGSDTRRWAPADRRLHRVLADFPPCRPCSHAECPHGHTCALAVKAEQVLAVARAQLHDAEGRPAHRRLMTSQATHASPG